MQRAGCAWVALAGILVIGMFLALGGSRVQTAAVLDEGATGGGVPGGPDRGWRADAERSDSGRFLDDLGAGEPAETDGCSTRTVYWRVESGLVDAAGAVLEQYGQEAGYELMASGYLDLFGNAWGAVIRGGDGCVDMVYATTDDQDGESVVRVVRLVPKG